MAFVLPAHGQVRVSHELNKQGIGGHLPVYEVSSYGTTEIRLKSDWKHSKSKTRGIVAC